MACFMMWMTGTQPGLWSLMMTANAVYQPAAAVLRARLGACDLGGVGWLVGWLAGWFGFFVGRRRAGVRRPLAFFGAGAPRVAAVYKLYIYMYRKPA